MFTLCETYVGKKVLLLVITLQTVSKYNCLRLATLGGGEEAHLVTVGEAMSV